MASTIACGGDEDNKGQLLCFLWWQYNSDAGWSSSVARRAHNPKVVGSNPAPATNYLCPWQAMLCGGDEDSKRRLLCFLWWQYNSDAGWSSSVARRAHNPKVVGSNPAPATNYLCPWQAMLCGGDEDSKGQLLCLLWWQYNSDAGWSSSVARRAHNPKVVGSNPAPATNYLYPWQGSALRWRQRQQGASALSLVVAVQFGRGVEQLGSSSGS